MKKIGVFTFHRAHNYGALLQAFALQQFLNIDYECYMVDYINNSVYDNYKIMKPIGKNVFKYPFRIYNNLKYYKKNKSRFMKFNNFINENLNILKLENIDECFALITGSDQVWNYNITGGLKDEYTLNFPNNKSLKISYAASIGDVNLIDKDVDNYKNKLKKIDFISVREMDLKEKISKLLNEDVELVLDPTLLLTAKEWDKYLYKNKNNEKYILAYVVEPDEEYIKIVNEISKETGFKVIYFEKMNPGYNDVLLEAYVSDPFEFIEYIKNAEYIITTSFHATVFSIIYQKKFWVIPHKKTGSRVNNLLSNLNIKNRSINNILEFKNRIFDEDIDYKSVNKLLNERVKKSKNWILEKLNKTGDTNE